MAQNFTGSISNKIDIRTGQYKPTLFLGNIMGNNALGPSLPLSLCYDPQNSINQGFGVGWSLAGASYNASTGVLVHPNGGNYAIQFPANSQNELGIKYQKTKDFKLLQTSDSSELYILNSSGDVTVLKETSNGLSLPSMVLSQSGQKLYLNFDGKNRFIQLLDGDNTTVLIEANYDAAYATTLTMFPSKPFAQTFTFTLDVNECLTKITTTTQETGQLTWTFESLYSPENPQEIRINGNPTLLAVTYPTGLRESVVYNPKGFLLPDNQTYLPCIMSSRSDSGGGQPAVCKRYSYGPGNNNFLGTGSGIASTSASDDNLYASNYNSYTYWVQETILDDAGNPAFSYRRTYNKFHLMTEEIYSDVTNQATRQTINTYDASLETAQDISLVPSYFQNPLSITVTYTSTVNGQPSSKTYSRTREYYSDTYNNGASGPFSGLLKAETYYDNYQVIYTYYKADGTEPGCPEDPFIFPQNKTGWPSNHIKSVEVINTQTGHSISRMEIDYTQLNTQSKKDFLPQFFFAPKEYRLYTSGTYAAQRLMEYVTNAESPDYGRPKSLTVNTILAQAYGAQKTGDVGSTITHTYTYQADPKNADNIITTIATTGSQNTTTTEIHCVYRGNMMSFTDIYNNVHDFSYNSLGLMTREDYNTNHSAYNYQVNHSYTMDQRDSLAFNVVTSEISDSAGNQYQGQKKWLDGAGRTVWLDQRVAGSYYQGVKNAYNYFGELDTTTSLDVLPFSTEVGEDVAIATISSPNASSVRTAVYDLFRTVSGYTLSDGSSLSSAYDPATSATSIFTNTASNHSVNKVDLIERTLTNLIKDVSGTKTLLATTTNFNEYGVISAVSETLYNTDDNSTDVYTESYENDYVGRITKKTLNDGTSITLEYDPRFLQPRVTKVIYTDSKYKDTTLLECTYNVRGLVVSRSLIGRDLSYAKKYSYDYDPVFDRVTVVTLPDGTTWTYSYDNSAGGKVSIIQTNGKLPISKTFSYNRFGQVAWMAEQISNIGNSIVYDANIYDLIGRIISKQYTTKSYIKNNTQLSYSNTTSSITSYTDINGLTTKYTYNDKMQLIGMQNAFMRVTYGYDGYGRMSSKTTWQMQGVDTVNEASQHNSNYTYDSQSGLMTLIEEDQGRTKTFINMTYRPDGLLTQRTYGSSSTPPSPWRKETFTYDSRKRLAGYACVGTDATYLIMDSDGHAVTAQSYSYDDLNNITQIRTNYLENGLSKTKIVTFTYRTDNPFLIDKITNNDEDISISYDVCDRALCDDQSRSFTYDGFERLSSVNYKDTFYDLTYDATNALRIQINTKTSTNRLFFYEGYMPVSEYTADPTGPISNRISRLYTGNNLVGQTKDDIFAAIPVDSLGNSIFTDDATTLSSGVTPFGDSYQPSASLPNYHGLPYNEEFGGYMLGNGYRLYNPRIGRLNKPDSMPPHSKAGINPFAYAFNDPINFFDPSGHTPAPITTQKHNKHIGQYIEAGVGSLIMIGTALTAFIVPGGEAVGAAAAEEGFSALKVSRIALKVAGVGAAVVASGSTFAGIALENSHPQASKDCFYTAAAAGILFGGTRYLGGTINKVMEARARPARIAERAAADMEPRTNRLGREGNWHNNILHRTAEAPTESLNVEAILERDPGLPYENLSQQHYSAVDRAGEQMAAQPYLGDEVNSFANPRDNLVVVRLARSYSSESGFSSDSEDWGTVYDPVASETSSRSSRSPSPPGQIVASAQNQEALIPDDGSQGRSNTANTGPESNPKLSPFRSYSIPYVRGNSASA